MRVRVGVLIRFSTVHTNITVGRLNMTNTSCTLGLSMTIITGIHFSQNIIFDSKQNLTDKTIKSPGQHTYHSQLNKTKRLNTVINMVSKTFQARCHPSILVPTRNSSVAKPFKYDNGLVLTTRMDSSKETTSTDSDRSFLVSGYSSNRVKIDLTEVGEEREEAPCEILDTVLLTRNARSASLTPTSYEAKILEEWKPKEKVTSLVENLCYERLYSRSKEQQELGKKRREEIALASARRNHPPQKDFGVISPDRAANQYLKGLRQLQDKEARLRDLRARDLAQIRKNQEFSLAEGAFARHEDIQFQRKLEIIRYGYLSDEKDNTSAEAEENQVEVDSISCASSSTEDKLPPFRARDMCD